MNYTKDYTLEFKSERDIDLVSNLPETLTVEDYNKWYNLYFITKDCEVKKLHEIYHDALDIEGIDHYYYPDSVVEFAKKHNIKIEYISYAAICQMYIEDAGDFKIPEEYLPTYSDLKEVLVDGNKITRTMNYCETYNIYPEHFSLETCLVSYSKPDKKELYHYAICKEDINLADPDILTDSDIYKKGEVFRVDILENHDIKILSGDERPDIYTKHECTDKFIFILNTDVPIIENIKYWLRVLNY